MAGPLDGVTVLDLSAVISGPWCCQILADQGARVIKVEPRGIGDITRIGGYRVGTISAMFSSANRGKESLAIDLSLPQGVEVLRRLAAEADVLVQNFRPGAVDRMGIGFEALREINPRLIYVSINGFGATGPYSNGRVYDPIIQAISGVVSTQQSRDIPIPDLVRTLICDKTSAQAAAQAITAALFARERGRAEGQHIELAMLDAALYYLWPDTFMAHTFTGDDVVPGPTLYQVYRLQPTADGHIVYFAISDAEMFALFGALGHPEWAVDERFDSPVHRMANFETLGALLETEFLARTTDEVYLALQAAEVPSAKVNSIDEVFDDPQVLNNGAIHHWDLPGVGPARHARPPVKFSATQHDPVWAVDQLGESTESVLRSFGYDDGTLAELRSVGVVG